MQRVPFCFIPSGGSWWKTCAPKSYDESSDTLTATCVPKLNLDFGRKSDDGSLVNVKDVSSDPPKSSTVTGCKGSTNNVMNIHGELKCMPQLPSKL